MTNSMGIINKFLNRKANDLVRYLDRKAGVVPDLTRFEEELLGGIQIGIDYCVNNQTIILAAVDGNNDARRYIGYCYLHGDEGFPMDNDKAEYWLRSAGEKF